MTTPIDKPRGPAVHGGEGAGYSGGTSEVIAKHRFMGETVTWVKTADAGVFRNIAASRQTLEAAFRDIGNRPKPERSLSAELGARAVHLLDGPPAAAAGAMEKAVFTLKRDASLLNLPRLPRQIQ